MTIRYLIISALILLFTTLSRAQEQEYDVSQFPMDDIWLDDYIVDIASGKNGRIYILNRRQILLYENNEYVEVVNLLGKPKVRQLEEDALGRLWILYYYNPNDPIEAKISVWDTDELKELDIRTFFDADTKHLLNIQNDLLIKDILGNVHFLNSFKKEPFHYQDSKHSFHPSATPYILTNNLSLQTNPSNKSKIIETDDHIQFSSEHPFISKDQSIFSVVLNDLTNPLEALVDSIIRVTNYPFSHRTNFKFINSKEVLIYNDKDVLLINLVTQNYEVLTDDLADILSVRSILSIQKIGNQLVIGTTKGIISIIKSVKTYKSFLNDRSTSIRNIQYISRDSVLIATRYGLALYNPNTFKIKEIDLDNVKYGITKLGDKIITTSYSMTFYIFDKDDLENGGKEILPGNKIKSSETLQNLLALDSNRIIFVGNKNAFLYYLEDDRLDTFNSQDSNNSYYTSVGMFNNKLVAFGIEESHYLDIQSLTKSSVTRLAGLTVTSIYNESPSSIWICTKGNGLIKYDSEENIMDTFDISDGLLSLNVHSAHKDNRDRLWLSTDYGISVMDIETEDIITITSDDGLHENEMNRHSYLALPDGSVIYGTINGIIHFDPNTVELKSNLSAIYLDKMIVQNTRTNNMENIEHPKGTSIISIPNNYSNPNLHFEYGYSNKNKDLRYKLLGDGDNKWHRSNNGIISLGNSRKISGILIESKEELNTWSDPYVFNIDFAKPFYKNPYLYILGLLIGLSLLLYITKNAQKKSEERNKLIQNKVDSQTRQLSHKIIELSKSNTLNEDLFFIIGHDLKSPLTSLLDLNKSINYLIEKEDYISLSKLGASIESSSRNTLGVINRLLDWATTIHETEVTRQSIDVAKIIVIASQDLKELVTSKEIEIEHHHQGSNDFFSERESLIIIVRNLIQNAIKYSPKASKITIRSRVQSTSLTIAVEDHGVGISQERMNQINKGDFVDSTAGTLNEKGLGLGLRICKELAKRLHGNIIVFQNTLGGSIFTLRIPSKP